MSKVKILMSIFWENFYIRQYLFIYLLIIDLLSHLINYSSIVLAADRKLFMYGLAENMNKRNWTELNFLGKQGK